MGQALRHNHYTDPLWTGFYRAQLQNLKQLINYIKIGNVKVVRDFIREREISEKSYKDYPQSVIREIAPVEFACRIGNLTVLKDLIAKGFSPNGLSYTAPINIACSNKNLDIVKALVELYHVSIKKADKNGNTPLTSAIEGNAFFIVEYLVGKGLTIRSLDKRGDLLHEVAKRGHAPMCRYLVKAGMDVNKHDIHDDTPLKLAALHLHKVTCAVLLHAGADIKSLKICDITKFYLRRNVWKQASLRLKDYVDTVTLLVQNGADPDSQDSDGNTSLHYLIITNSLAAFLLVCDLNASLDKQNAKRETPFKLALKGDGKSSVAMMLLQAGYSPRPKECPIDSQLMNTSEGRKTVKLITELMNNPRTLQDLCCFRIRREIGAKLHQGVDRLGLPNRLKNMVMLRHVIPESANSQIHNNAQLETH